MAALPQLIEEDIRTINAMLDVFLHQSEALATLVIDKGGPIITQRGHAEQFDSTTLAALAAGSFCATQEIARLVGEERFSSIYQQGTKHSLLLGDIDNELVLVVIFKAEQSVGAIKFYAVKVQAEIAAQIQHARQRAPEKSVDLVSLNLMDVTDVFRKKE
jgi:predicted regulator of Ras-like GTPase activity (Roadblock/LC7/MglB family)